MQIQFKKPRNPEKPSTLHCTRPDGSSTWAHMHHNFEIHDLAHYVVETELELHNAFFGMLAAGHDIGDFALPRDARPDELIPANLPPEALLTEHMANLLLIQLTQGMSAEDFVAQLKDMLAKGGLPFPERLDTAMAMRMAQRLSELHRAWQQLDHGEKLVLNWVSKPTL